MNIYIYIIYHKIQEFIYIYIFLKKHRYIICIYIGKTYLWRGCGPVPFKKGMKLFLYTNRWIKIEALPTDEISRDLKLHCGPVYRGN